MRRQQDEVERVLIGQEGGVGDVVLLSHYSVWGAVAAASDDENPKVGGGESPFFTAQRGEGVLSL